MIPKNLIKALFFINLFHFGQPIQVINAEWSTGSFSTIAGKAGNENGHSAGFSLLDENGKTIYSNGFPNDRTPCQQGGYTFKLSGGCFAGKQEYHFECTSAFDATPKSCEVRDADDNSLNSGEGNSDIEFVGIAVAENGYCGVSFPLNENVHCEPDSDGFNVSE